MSLVKQGQKTDSDCSPRIQAMTLLMLLLTGTAHAGDGPWTLNPGEDSLFVGVSTFRYNQFQDSKTGQVTSLGDGVTATGLVGVFTTGLAEGLELEVVLPYERVRVNDRGNDFCNQDNRPADFCKTSAGVGDASAVLKGRVLNELYASPVTLSLAAGARSGELYSDHRDRLTTLGDGNTDLGAGLSVGRTDLLGDKGHWYRVGAWGWYWYRLAHEGTTWATKVPADEVSYTLEATISPHHRFGFGPAVQGFHRLGGVSFSEMDFASENHWSSLKAAQIQAGGKVGIYTDGGPTFALAVLRTVWAQNNPSDTLVVTAGLGWFWPEGVPLKRLGAG
jgi:hypothetical protein